jgi:hypothetical protein
VPSAARAVPAHASLRRLQLPDAATSVVAVEQHGIESIPDRDRTATIFDFMRIEWGGLNSLATAVLGAFPIIYG